MSGGASGRLRLLAGVADILLNVLRGVQNTEYANVPTVATSKIAEQFFREIRSNFMQHGVADGMKLPVPSFLEIPQVAVQGALFKRTQRVPK